MSSSKRKKIIRFCLIAVLSCILLVIILLCLEDKLLNLNRPINAKILVVEGWLGSEELKLVKKNIFLNQYETIYVTGIAHDHPYYLLNESRSKIHEMPAQLFINGCLGLRSNALEKITDSISKIQIFASSGKVLQEYAHFFVTVDDVVVGNSFVGESPSGYVFTLKQPMLPKKNICIYYDNSLYSNKTNRILRVDSMAVNETVFNNPDDYYRVYDNQFDENLYTYFPFRSNAEFAANYLKAIGIKNKIEVVDTFYNKRNKTFVAAIRFSNELKKKKIEAFNIVSLHGHSRRSYLAYKTAMASERTDIGIITIENHQIRHYKSFRGRIFHLLDDYFSLLATWLIKISS